MGDELRGVSGSVCGSFVSPAPASPFEERQSAGIGVGEKGRTSMSAHMVASCSMCESRRNSLRSGASGAVYGLT